VRQQNSRYDKSDIEAEAKISKASGIITEALGRFILDRCNDAVNTFFVIKDDELRQAMIDEAIMRICEKFLVYYEEDRSAANLVIAMAKTTMINKLKSLSWSDTYGQKIKTRAYVFGDGEWVVKLIRSEKDDNISKDL
jgi:hypothetical protein